MFRPLVIQGGMGIGVSSAELARAVSGHGQLGVVSGTLVHLSFLRKLQDGDRSGEIRRAMELFPCQKTIQEILKDWFIVDGKDPSKPYKQPQMFGLENSESLLKIGVVSSFVEIMKAKFGHNGPVGINLLEKLQIANLAPLYGAMLAGVDYVLMGAGIPREIPGVLDQLSSHSDVSLTVPVENIKSGQENARSFLSPTKLFDTANWNILKRPFFFPIVSSATLALNLSKKSTGRVDGFIIELPSAGGHNAPPRGQVQLNEKGEPIYGTRDEVDFQKFRELGYPFWLAGGYSSPEKLKEALNLGASGVQIGSAFALANESGLTAEIRETAIQKILNANKIDDVVFTDPLASPSGFPFKVMQIEQTLSEAKLYEDRRRICDIGVLRNAYYSSDGKLGLRCASEPVEAYVKKEGSKEATVGRKCLCNALMVDIGLGQKRSWGDEKSLLTLGSDLQGVSVYLKKLKNVGHKISYSASDFLNYILS